jgi:hypothetical protein
MTWWTSMMTDPYYTPTLVTCPHGKPYCAHCFGEQADIQEERMRRMAAEKTLREANRRIETLEHQLAQNAGRSALKGLFGKREPHAPRLD